jgi:hypothetical protein
VNYHRQVERCGKPGNQPALPQGIPDKTLWRRHRYFSNCTSRLSLLRHTGDDRFLHQTVGLKFAAGPASRDGRKPYGEEVDLIHIFFHLPSAPPAEGDYSMPYWVSHIAFEVPDMDALHAGKRHLEEAGVEHGHSRTGRVKRRMDGRALWR